ncbi:MAG TPA: hypothetical protein VFL14_09070, partial [Xanthomonadales bacterium]|nr:hypothetical protein [Xanthomonadales bacterium]
MNRPTRRGFALLLLLGASPFATAAVTTGMPLLQRLDAGRVGDALATDDQYGSAVAADGNVAVAGAFRARQPGQATGAAYMLVRTPPGRWRVAQELLPPGGADGDRFGESVAIAGDDVFVGAPGDDTAGSDAGAVYHYRRTAPGIDAWSFV